MNARRLLPSSLNARLVAVSVLLVAVVGAAVCATTTVAMRSYLTGKLDQDVRGSVSLSISGLTHGFSRPPTGDGDQPGHQVLGQGPGTLSAYFVAGQSYGFDVTSSGGRHQLSNSALRMLDRTPVDDQVHRVTLPDVGSYRVLAVTEQTNFGRMVVVTGLPTRSVDEAMSSLLWWLVLVTLCGVGAAAVIGTILVHRTLRPLRTVAAAAHQTSALDLASGAGRIAPRVPAEHTDPQTEVGLVGAALNTLLDHVEQALDIRHRSEQQVRRFVADASHELRTPLSTIQGYAELSRRTPDDPAALSAAMGKVETESGRMRTIVEDLLLLARLDSGRPLEHEEVDLSRMLVETVTDARVVAPSHRFRLDLPEEPVVVAGDEQRLHQAVTNLVSNAIRHTPLGTTVTVGARAGSPVVVSVHDDGPGLPPSLAAVAFERFVRGDSSRTRASGGAGLGLSLVSAIADAHGGSASVQSGPGSTTFTLELPADREPARDARSPDVVNTPQA